MIASNTIEELAKTLREANQNKIPCAPLRNIIGVEDIESAYAIQEINNQIMIDQGARIVGRKIGLTSKAVQKQLGVDQPDYGALFNTTEILNGDAISVKELMQAKVEGEIAFVMNRTLDNPTITTMELLSAIEYVVPSIEIVGSRIENWNIKITDTIADNASASHFAIGHRPIKIENIDLINCQMQMTKNGEVVSEGSGASCLGSPINATLWLARTMAQLGTPIQAGEIILSGALGPMAVVSAGDSFVANFSGLGSVSIHFED